MKVIHQPKLEAVFFRSNTGNEPVREWIQSLSKEDKRSLGEDIQTVQFGWPLGMPLVKNLGNGLWEIRSSLQNNRIARIIFFTHEDNMILVHGFVKKNQKIPQNEIRLALHRKKEFEHE